jgi:putative hydrolase of the HAD superfamily
MMKIVRAATLVGLLSLAAREATSQEPVPSVKETVIYLERNYVASGIRAVGEWCSEHLDLKGVQEHAQALFDQGIRGRIFDAALDRLGVGCDAETVSEMVRIYREHAPGIKLLPDADECLARLQGRVRLGLLTDGNPVSQWAKIDALGLRGRFDTTVVTGEWGSEFFKPHVRGYQHLETQHATCQGRFVYVADNPLKDFFAPRVLGWNAIRVRRPAGLHGDLECSSGLARFEVSNLESVPNLVCELYKRHF